MNLLYWDMHHSGYLHLHVLTAPVGSTCPLLPGSNPSLEAKLGGGYSWAPSNHPSFFAGRQASITARGRVVGIFGIVHPEVLGAFDLEYPVSALELNIEPFCFDSDLQQLLEGAGTEGSIHGWNLVH